MISEEWWANSENEQAWLADADYPLLTFCGRLTEDNRSEVAIVRWWHKTPYLVALFHNGVLVRGEALESA